MSVHLLVELGHCFVWFRDVVIMDMMNDPPTSRDSHLVLPRFGEAGRSESGCGLVVEHDDFVSPQVQWQPVDRITCETCRLRALLAVLREERQDR